MHFYYKILQKLSFSLAILPALILGTLIYKYGVNLPYWDQWIVGRLFEKFHNNSLTFNDFFEQQNESRLFFPKLVFLSLGLLTRWDVRAEMWVIFLLACIVSLNIYWLLHITVSGSTLKRILIATFCNLLIFSPIQLENWLWGIQIVVFVPIVCLTSCILISYSRLSAKAKFLICMCLCTVSTYSYANGLLCWILALPIVILNSRKELAKHRWLLVVWIIGFIFNTVAYFYNYQKPSYHPSFLEALKHPVQATHYFISFIGAPFAFGVSIDTLTVATIIGLVLILLFLASSFYAALKAASDSKQLILLAGWLTIGWYAIASDAITTLGRVGFGVAQAMSSRYSTFAVYLAVSLIPILVIILDNLKNKVSITKNILAQLPAFLVGILLVLHLQSSVFAVQVMSNNRVDYLQRKACLVFINVLPEDCLTKKVFPDLNDLKNTANNLNNLGFLNPSLVTTSRIQDIEGKSNLSSTNYGYFDRVKKVNSGVYVASGWAILPERRESADSVILTYEKTDGEPTMFALINTLNDKRNDVAKAFKEQSYSNSGWKRTFASSKLPSGSLKVEAWAFNSNTGKAFHLNGTHVIQN